jgi:hypothetical protein
MFVNIKDIYGNSYMFFELSNITNGINLLKAKSQVSNTHIN